MNINKNIIALGWVSCFTDMASINLITALSTHCVWEYIKNSGNLVELTKGVWQRL